MNPSQMAAMSTLLSVPQRPRIVDWTANTVAGATLTATLPHRREAGLLALYFGAAIGASAPATPTGWTSIQTGTSTIPSRAAYKFLDGSEAATFSSAASGASQVAGVVVTIAGSLSSRAPVGSTRNVASAGTSVDPPSLNATAPYGTPLWFPWLAMSVNQEETGRPIGFSTQHRMTAGLTGLSLVVCAETIAVGTLDVSAFTFATANAATGVIVVRGA